MARLHVGTWGENYNCSVCRGRPGQKIAWGCNERARINEHYWPLFQDGIDVVQLSSCPFCYVPVSVLMWMREYLFYKSFQGARMPSYRELCPKWIEAMNIYENEYCVALKEKNNE